MPNDDGKTGRRIAAVVGAIALALIFVFMVATAVGPTVGPLTATTSAVLERSGPLMIMGLSLAAIGGLILRPSRSAAIVG